MLILLRVGQFSRLGYQSFSRLVVQEISRLEVPFCKDYMYTKGVPFVYMSLTQIKRRDDTLSPNFSTFAADLLTINFYEKKDK